MDKAVGYLDSFLQQKTVHSTASLLAEMQEICDMKSVFTDQEAQQEFAQKCRNFEIYSRVSNKNSWGRNQFEEWWNNEPHHMKRVLEQGRPLQLDEFPRHAMNIEPCEGGYKLTTPWGPNPGEMAFVPLEAKDIIRNYIPVKETPPWEDPKETNTENLCAENIELKKEIKRLNDIIEGIKDLANQILLRK